MIESAIDLLVVAVAGLVGWQLRSAVALSRQAIARYEATKEMYETTNARLSEHIRSPLHKG